MTFALETSAVGKFDLANAWRLDQALGRQDDVGGNAQVELFELFYLVQVFLS